MRFIIHRLLHGMGWRKESYEIGGEGDTIWHIKQSKLTVDLFNCWSVKESFHPFSFAIEA